jgi:HEAT repeat protein
VPGLDSLLTALTCGDDDRAEAAAAGLARLGARAVPALLHLLDSAVADERWWAARALAACGRRGALEGLLRALRDPVPEVRQCAAVGLREVGDPRAIPGLGAALEDADQSVSRLAAEALASLGPAAVSTLEAALRSGAAGVRINAARGLARAGDPSAVPALLAALQDPSPVVRHWAQAGLDRMAVGLAKELRPHGIPVIGVSPGPTLTERATVGDETYGYDLSRRHSVHVPAAVVDYLLSSPDPMAYTGQVLEAPEFVREHGLMAPEDLRTPFRPGQAYDPYQEPYWQRLLAARR